MKKSIKYSTRVLQTAQATFDKIISVYTLESTCINYKHHLTNTTRPRHGYGNIQPKDEELNFFQFRQFIFFFCIRKWDANHRGCMVHTLQVSKINKCTARYLELPTTANSNDDDETTTTRRRRRHSQNLFNSVVVELISQTEIQISIKIRIGFFVCDC